MTVDVPVDSTVRIAIPFEDRSGARVSHCHILDRAQASMMGQLYVLPWPAVRSHDTLRFPQSESDAVTTTMPEPAAEIEE